jgi:spermidine/putrescine ABC transporter ATP-binding subunit
MNENDTDPPFLAIENLHKHFGGVHALNGISLSVRAEEFVTFLGPSGSGKTTLLMAVAGFVRPTRGRICLAGRDLTRVPPYRRGFGMVFQDYALFPHMSVAENVAFPLKMRKTPADEIRRRVEEMLSLVRLEGLGSRRPDQLSGGQQQRVSLARALVFRPYLLLMDEPLGALDRKLREEMQVELKRIQRQLGITVLSVTHDQEEALTLSDRVAVIRNGVLEQVDTAHDIYERPKSRFVAGFIGETNFVDVRVDSIENGAMRVSGQSIPPMHIPTVQDVSAGETVSLSVRPEKIALSTAPVKTPDQVTGIVEEVVYMGDITKYFVRLNETSALVVKQSNGEGRPRRNVGETVGIEWNPENSVAFKQDISGADSPVRHPAISMKGDMP